MKKQLFTLVALGVLFITASAHAQTINVKANIPFDFVVGQQTMPKGEYQVESLGTPGSNVLVIRSADGSANKVQLGLSCESLQAAKQSKMVFRHYGERYFLAEVWTLGNNAGYEFPQSRIEKELAKSSPATSVYVAAMR